MQSPATDAAVKRRANRSTLWLILAVCAAPVVASYLVYHFWRPAAQVNYGTLIEPRPLADVELTFQGRPFRLSELKGDWVLLTAGPAKCDDACREKLVYMRQVRLAQGRESGRVERLWLLTDAANPDPALLADHIGLRIARGGEALVSALPAPRDPADHVYVVDPLGNLMMRFPERPDPRRMLNDLSRLLRHSKWK